METKTKKKRLYNAIMILAGLVFVGAGVAFALNLKATDNQSFSFDNQVIENASSKNSEGKNPAQSAAESGEVISTSPGAAAVLEGSSSTSSTQDTSSTNQGSTTGSSSASKNNNPTCTIEIRCDTILNNMSSLTQGKGAYVPANGIILATSTVQFAEGETAFDVLKAACSATGIQLEYTYTPGYDSYYVQGINNLYEFDCGNESGWMFKVNGWFPNYGSSAYTLKDGDVVVWCYTCNGLGADVGGSMG